MPARAILSAAQKNQSIELKQDRSFVTNKSRDSLSRGLQLLRYLVESREAAIGVRAAAKALGVAPSTAHQLMQTLASAGYLARDEDAGSYTLGHEFMILSHRATERVSMRAIAIPHLRNLVAACGESAFLNLYNRDRQEFFALASIESAHVLRYVAEMYTWKPVHVGAAGWAIMAHLSASERREIMARTKLAPLTDQSLRDPAALEEALAIVRARGYACTHGQRVSGTVGFSAPIFGVTGRVLGGVALSLPEPRFDPSREPALAQALLSCAQAITAECEATPPAEGSQPRRRASAP